MTPSPRDQDRELAALLAPDILAWLEESPGDLPSRREELHPKSLADVAEAIPRDKVAESCGALPPARAADVLEYLDEELRSGLLEAMSTEQAVALVSEMTPDDRADILEELEEETPTRSSRTPRRGAPETQRLLQYEADTAGGLMTTEFVSVQEHLTVEAALAIVRTAARSGRKEAMHAVYVTDDRDVLVGVMSLRELLAAPEGARVSEVAWTEVVKVPATADAPTWRASPPSMTSSPFPSWMASVACSG